MQEFNFDDFMEDSSSEFERKISMLRERMLEQAIEDNFKKIEEAGMNRNHLLSLDPIQLADLNLTIKKMIQYFEDEEQYERCAILLPICNEIDSLMLEGV
jgi:hypothetical protein